MASANELIQSTRVSIAKLVNSYRTGAYFVDDSFQRRLVWGAKQKIRLIETVLIGYPIPEIYIHRQATDTKTGHERFSIVDGQQRISTFAQFISNEWKLGATSLDPENRGTDFAECYWDDLSSKRKSQIYEFMINVREIPTIIETDQIRRIFKRLNETDRSLNPQEIRHAQFTGKFVQFAEKMADKDFWSYWEVFTDRQVRRMADVEFTTSLLSYLKNGIVTDSASAINKLYDTYNDTYPGIREDQRKIEETLSKIDYIFEKNEDVSNFFKKTVHLYTLFVIIDQNDFVPNKSNMVKRLQEFVILNEAQNKSSIILQYRRGSEQRTRSKTSREIRHEALLKFLRGS